MRRAPTLYDGDDNEIELPFKWEICSTCRGNGKSSAYLGAFTASEMDEEGIDFQNDYMAGFYDRTCDVCGGAGKIKVADLSKMTKAQRKALREQQQADYECEQEARMEQRMLGDWRGI